jgi:hypothetical protein
MNAAHTLTIPDRDALRCVVRELRIAVKAL